MRYFQNHLSVLTGRTPLLLSSSSSSYWLTNKDITLKTNVPSYALFQESTGLFPRRHLSRFLRRPIYWQQFSFINDNNWYISKRFSHLSSFTLGGEVDRYQGVWVDLSRPNKNGFYIDNLSEEEFDCLLKDSLKTWRNQGMTSVWINFNLNQGKLLPVMSRYGFTFHHAEGNLATLVSWIDTGQNKIPMFATHQVGVSGIVIKEETKEVLIVQDKNRPFKLWKFPGGLSDLGEDIADTAEREVFEETGLKTEFQSVLAFRQHHHLPGAFGRSDLYVLCRLKPLTFEFRPCEEEISACRWMSVDELRKEVHTSSLTLKLAELVLIGLDKGFEHVDITSYEMASLHKGLKFTLFHRPIQ